MKTKVACTIPYLDAVVTSNNEFQNFHEFHFFSLSFSGQVAERRFSPVELIGHLFFLNNFFNNFKCCDRIAHGGAT